MENLKNLIVAPFVGLVMIYIVNNGGMEFYQNSLNYLSPSEAYLIFRSLSAMLYIHLSFLFKWVLEECSHHLWCNLIEFLTDENFANHFREKKGKGVKNKRWDAICNFITFAIVILYYFYTR